MNERILRNSLEIGNPLSVDPMQDSRRGGMLDGHNTSDQLVVPGREIFGRGKKGSEEVEEKKDATIQQSRPASPELAKAIGDVNKTLEKDQKALKEAYEEIKRRTGGTPSR